MKTPDKIKKGLTLCSDICKSGNGCPYAIHGLDCAEELMSDSLAFFQQLESQNAELLTKVKQLETKCHQLERERDAAVECIGRLMIILKTYPYAATNGCAYQAYCEIQKHAENMRGVKEE